MWANRPSSKGSKSLFPVTKAIQINQSWRVVGRHVQLYDTSPMIPNWPWAWHSWNCTTSYKFSVSIKKMGEGWTGRASDIVKANSSWEDPRATGGLASFFCVCVVVCSAGHLHRLSNLDFFHFLRLYISPFRFFLRSDIPFSFFSPTFFEIGQSFLHFQGVTIPNNPFLKVYSPPIWDRTMNEVRSEQSGENQEEKETDSNKTCRKRTKISGTLVRLLWRAAAPGLKPLRLPRAHLPHPRVNKTQEHTQDLILMFLSLC